MRRLASIVLLAALAATVILVVRSCRGSAPGGQNAAAGQEQQARDPLAEEPAAAPRAPAEPGREERPPVGESLLRAPGDYYTTVVGTRFRAERQLNLAAVQQTINAYKALNGSYPESLKALEEWSRTPLEPPPHYVYQYDPSTGTITLVREEG